MMWERRGGARPLVTGASRLSTRSESGLKLGEESSTRFWRDTIITREQCTSAKAKRLYDYWDSLRQGRKMPSRRDIDPTAVFHLLPNIHLSDWFTNPDRVRYRLAGTELVASIGREISNRWLSEFHTDPSDLNETLSLYRKVALAAEPVFGSTVATNLRVGVDHFEWVLCPLSEDDMEVTSFIGLEDYISQRRYLGGAS
jgi:hypothetical protein